METLIILLLLGGIAYYAVTAVQKKERERAEAEQKAKASQPTDVIGGIARVILDAAMKKKH
jgi:hypothetical protein